MPRVDPYRNYRFLVEIDGIVQAGFLECSGLGSSVEVVEYREGGDLTTVRKLRGKVSYPDIMLKWGITDSRELYDWHLTAVNGEVERKNGSIVLLDDRGQEKVRWNFFNAWPSKYDAPSFDAKGSDVAIDSLSMCCERVERA
ncbi:MAG: phage tail protein [Nostocaceae cyanobacterium]|nr:phage tail protein [Nostocaceae cyanobacterium]